MKARNGLDESIRELFSIPVTCNATGRDKARGTPQSWGVDDRDVGMGSPGLQQGNLVPEIWVSSQGMEWGSCCTTRNKRKGQKNWIVWFWQYEERQSSHVKKLKKREKEELFPHVLSKDQITSGKAEVIQEEKSSAGETLNALGGWSTAGRGWMSIYQKCHRSINHCQREEDGWDDMWRSLPTLSPCLHTARMWDELSPGGLHQHFHTRQALYSVKANSALNKKKRKTTLL